MTINIPMDAIIFDCDGTLSTIEGIDFLAAQNGVEKDVATLTSDAMGKTGLTPEIYRKRLDLVKPTRSQVNELGESYFKHITTDTAYVIQALQKLNKSIYIISAGLSLAVKQFGNQLKIPSKNIFAVDVFFDAHGNYQDFDTTSPLITNVGKRVIVTQLMNKHDKMAYIGDGLNDLSIIDLVTRFIGYGGSYYRKNIEEACEFYVKSKSMKEILPLVLTKKEWEFVRS